MYVIQKEENPSEQVMCMLFRKESFKYYKKKNIIPSIYPNCLKITLILVLIFQIKINMKIKSRVRKKINQNKKRQINKNKFLYLQ